MKLTVSTIKDDSGKEKVLFLASMVQVSYPRLWEAENRGNRTFGKGAAILFDKTDPDAMAAVEKIQNFIDKKMIPEEFNGNELPDEMVCLKDGDRKGGKERFKGHWYLTTNKPNGAITVFEPGGTTPLTRAEYDQLPENQKITDGCWVALKFQLWAQKNVENGNRINGEPLAIRWSKYGEPLSSEASLSKEDTAAGFEDEDVDAGEEW